MEKLLADADEFLHGTRAIAVPAAGYENLAGGSGVGELIVDEHVTRHGETGQGVGQKGQAQSLAGGMIGRHELIEIEAYMRCEAARLA